jgi:hypothetical protein
MGLLSQISLVAGAFLVGLVAVAMLVSGWELLRQRELLDQLRRDRAAFAATSPLPLAQPGSMPASGPAFARVASLASGGADANAGALVPAASSHAAHGTNATLGDSRWIETRPSVLSPTRAVDGGPVAHEQQFSEAATPEVERERERELDLSL